MKPAQVSGQGDDHRVSLGALVGQHSNALKGLLILLVVMDHNEWLRHLAPDLFKPLTFHVLGFLFLAFAFPDKALTKQFALDRACRYLVPFWWVLAFTSLMFALTLGRDVDRAAQAGRWLLAAFLGNAPYVKASSGFLMLWYLPCMFGLTILLGSYNRFTQPGQRSFIWLLALAAHLLLPLVGTARLMLLPFGLAIGLEIFVLGLLWRALLDRRVPTWWYWPACLVLVGSYGSLVAMSTNIEIGTLDVHGVDQPGLLLLQDLAGLSGVLVMVALAAVCGRLRWLRAIGQHSMLVYLLHPLVYQVIYRLPGLPRPSDPSPLRLLIAGALGVAVATAVAYGLSVLVERSPTVSKWFTPRYWREWPPARFFAKA